VWLTAARRFGLEVRRADDVFASSDGRGGLTLGVPDSLDADDCVAQMVFHELCHSLVAGEPGLSRPDWGLPAWSEDLSAVDTTAEHATLRLQAALASAHGLRTVLAPTTDFRAYYDALPQDPLSAGDDPAIPLACAALARVDQPPWSPLVRDALDATEAIVRVVSDLPHAAGELPSLFAGFEPASS